MYPKEEVPADNHEQAGDVLELMQKILIENQFDAQSAAELGTFLIKWVAYDQQKIALPGQQDRRACLISRPEPRYGNPDISRAASIKFALHRNESKVP